MTLRPFWRYFGGKWRAARRYPAPAYPHLPIVEPFAGAAGYSCAFSGEFWRRDVTLVESNPVIAEIWRYLVATTAAEILSLPDVECLDALPASTPEAARLFIGMCFGAGDTRPRPAVSPMVRRDGGWVKLRDRAARQVDRIRHWRVIEGDYTAAPDVEAVWFIDPPYQARGGRDTRPGGRGRVRYPCGADDLDFDTLASWCRSRRGQVIVCENDGAEWLPFRPFIDTATVGVRGQRSREVVWTNDAEVRQ